MASLPEHLRPEPVGKQQLSREARAQYHRARILTSGLAVFTEHGYSDSTVDDIVVAAEIGVGSFYTSFSGKEDLLLQVYDQMVEQAKAEVAAAVSGATAWEERICRGLGKLLVLVAEEPKIARIALIELQTAGGPALTRYEETLAEIAKQLRAGRKVVNGAWRLPQSLELTLANSLAYLLRREMSKEEVKSVPRFFAELAQLALEPYLGQDRARRVVTRISDAPA